MVGQLSNPSLVLPELALRDGELRLRPWSQDDAAALNAAVADSVEHLRPWMEWIAGEPQTVSQRGEWILQSERDRASGGQLLLGTFVDGAIAGGCGLHARVGVGGLEIGYWTHPEFLRRGVATAASRLLTSAAFSLPGISFVEIHHDKANVASGGVPRKLGFELVDESRKPPTAPGEIGIECRWRVARAVWLQRQQSSPPAPD
ncbi:MAG TPA: GNAT family N-acetyltransferase [Solirubrobacteraceae bacterium]